MKKTTANSPPGRAALYWAMCLMAALALVLLGGCGGGTGMKPGSTKTVATGEGVLGAPDSTTAEGVYSGATDYHIGPSDLLEINVFQIDELNRTVRVNSNGQVSLPLVGSITAGGKTVEELEAEIGKQLEAGYLQNPQVTVFVKEFTSQRVTMEGAVKSPGIYPLTGRTSLLQAIAMASGVTDLANLKGIVVFRVIDGKKQAAAFDLAQIRTGSVPDPQIYGDDIVVVDQSGAKTGLRRVLEALPILNVFTVY